mmetsp:Transcript_55550/g.113037  ORF Transcript_55550/g.113037 Transcript_55550/m.113037 type:complete len:201 (+) Transcript_55550:1020-1622(+)
MQLSTLGKRVDHCTVADSISLDTSLCHSAQPALGFLGILYPHTDRNKCIVCRDIRLHSGCVHLFQHLICSLWVRTARKRLQAGVEAHTICLNPLLAHLAKSAKDSGNISLATVGVNQQVEADGVRYNLALQHVVKQLGCACTVSSLAAGTEEHVVADGICLHSSLSHASEPILCSIDITSLRQLVNDSAVAVDCWLNTTL